MAAKAPRSAGPPGDAPLVHAPVALVAPAARCIGPQGGPRRPGGSGRSGSGSGARWRRADPGSGGSERGRGGRGLLRHAGPRVTAHARTGARSVAIGVTHLPVRTDASAPDLR